MGFELLTPRAVKCPHCGHKHHINEDVSSGIVRIDCPMCHLDFGVNLKTMKVVKRVGDNETKLQHRLRCPHGCNHYFFYEKKIDNIIGDKCSICGRYFRGNMLYSRTWPAKPQSKE